MSINLLNLKKPRFLLYAHDGTGIGHLVRTCLIGQKIIDQNPDAEVFIISGSPVLSTFAPEKAAYVSLPTLPRVDDDPTHINEIKLKRRSLTDLRRKLIHEIANEFMPHVLLIDHLPLGKREELDMTIEALHHAGTQIVMGFRRIHEDPAFLQQMLNHQRNYETLEKYFRAVLVYAPSWIEEKLGILDKFPIKQHYVGFTCRKTGSAKSEARKKLKISPANLIITCAPGSGRNSRSLMERILSIYQKTTRPPNSQLLIFSGPFLDLNQIDQNLLNENVMIIHNSIDYPLGIAAADAVISTAGYNSILEALFQKRPLWVIPNQTIEQEQENSARFLQKLGYLSLIPQDKYFEHELTKVFNTIYECNNLHSQFKQMPDEWFDGDIHTVEFLSRLADEVIFKQ